MLLLHPPPGPDQRPLVALFGVGLIGGALASRLRDLQFRSESIDFGWGEPQGVGEQLAAIGERVAELATRERLRVEVVWSAGRAGFSAGESEVAAELETFRRALAGLAGLGRRLPERTTVHLIGSIGGLFEGCRHVGPGSVPRPLRPYGRLKLAQESALCAAPVGLCKRIYRASSVFGDAVGASRRGLIATLLHNGLQRRVTRIVGALDTLRDYVWSDDLARHLAREIISPRAAQPEARVDHLATGRPMSIFEVVRAIERALGRPLYVHFSDERSNSRHITVSSQLLPDGWKSTELSTALRCLRSDAPRAR